MSEGDRGDARWIAQVARSWSPAPLDEAGRTRFDARLRERLAESRERGAWRPRAVWAGVAMAGALAALVGLGIFGGRPPFRPPATPAEDAARVAWEWDLLLGGEGSGELGEALPDDDLPEEWKAIASVFLAP